MSVAELHKAAEIVRQADAILVHAGAGMGVDSGLPDFRGDEGFWRAYPPMKRLGLSFYEMANPRWFEQDPSLAWGFYGHRLQLYRDTKPHRGFELLRQMAGERSLFAVTSNVDGAFAMAGFAAESIYEVHGSIHHLQCSAPCCDVIWQMDKRCIVVDVNTFRASSELPTCPRCGRVARPNILMFGDYSWVSERSDEQHRRWMRWIANQGQIAVIEIGAGTTVPTLRRMSEELARRGSKVIRINPRDSEGYDVSVSLATTGLAGLRAMHHLI
ncbi:MAG: NAD-dependent deacetylase [Myxococcales bacterium]|nr:NAD-dependent deacetylase [Myxococcales bacterium]